MKRASAALLLAVLGTVVHGKDDSALKNVPALVILQRTPRADDAMQDTSYQPGGRLVKLSPPSADGTATVLCCSQFPGFEAADIQSYDISFDARSIVFAGRLSANDRYSLYILTLNDRGEAAGTPENLTIDPNFDFVYPVFAPGQRIIFITDKNVEGDDVPQVTSGIVRGVTSQLGSVTVTGTDLVLGPRNLSHRAFPTMQTDGRVLFSEVRSNDNGAAQLAMRTRTSRNSARCSVAAGRAPARPSSRHRKSTLAASSHSVPRETAPSRRAGSSTSSWARSSTASAHRQRSRRSAT